MKFIDCQSVFVIHADRHFDSPFFIFFSLSPLIHLLCEAPKLRRRRPTTSSPLKKDNDKTELGSETLPKVTTARRKAIVTANRRSEIASSVDQIPASSVNRFRVRSKPKLESVAASGNGTLEFAASTKDKKSKDGYKVNKYAYHLFVFYYILSICNDRHSSIIHNKMFALFDLQQPKY